ncbi:MAG: SpoIIIAC/SpoIIIAD family protein, partial [Oscillospiraceae bacterium]
MVILRLCAIAAVTAVCALILKSHKSELAPLCVAAGGVLMILYAFDYVSESLDLLKQFTEQTGISSSVIRVIFKIIGIGYVVELTASSVKDLGFESIADKLI